MRFRSILLSGLFLALPVLVLAQDEHIKTKYLDDQKRTVVSIDPMIVWRTQFQKVEVNVSFNYPKQKLTKPPKWINFWVRSLGTELRYPKPSERKFVVLADGEPIDLDSSRDDPYLATRWVFEKDKLVGYTLRPQVKNGIVLDENGKPIVGSIEEVFAVTIAPKNFLKLANAKSIVINIGSDSFTLTDNQLNAVRSLAKLTLPQPD